MAPSVSNSSLRSAAAGLAGSLDELGALGVVGAELGMGLVTVVRAKARWGAPLENGRRRGGLGGCIA
jgi:hypothetical protein